ncbi:MAG: hypothetical protein ABEJ64_03875 [Candidatus Nanohaloarchaea archaeon]
MGADYEDAIEQLTYDIDIAETQPEGYDWRELRDIVEGRSGDGPLDPDAEPADGVELLEMEEGINAGPR